MLTAIRTDRLPKLAGSTAALLGLLLGVSSAPLAAQATELEISISDAVADAREDGVDLLEQLVNINSYTLNPTGVRRVAEVLRPHLDALGFTTRWIDGSPFDRAGHLFAERRGDGATNVLIISHLDTVYPGDAPFQIFTRVDDSTVAGPGVSDNKGGLVTMLLALRSLDAAGVLDGMNLTLALIGDEERSGSPRELSRGDLVAAARWADVALGFEDGDGNPATAAVARRGGTGWTLTTSGVRGHSSLIFGEALGFGAVYEAARILNAFREELAGEQYLTFNPGLILGGSEVTHDPSTSSGAASGVSNVVSETVTVTGDLRAISSDQARDAMQRMQDIASQHLPGTSATLEFRSVPSGMPPTEGNYRLHAMYDQVSRDIGAGPVSVIDPSALGGADITGAAPYVRGALAGIGMSGADAHSFDETADLNGMIQQAQRAAVLLLRLSRMAFQ